MGERRRHGSSPARTASRRSTASAASPSDTAASVTCRAAAPARHPVAPYRQPAVSASPKASGATTTQSNRLAPATLSTSKLSAVRFSRWLCAIVATRTQLATKPNTTNATRNDARSATLPASPTSANGPDDDRLTPDVTVSPPPFSVTPSKMLGRSTILVRNYSVRWHSMATDLLSISIFRKSLPCPCPCYSRACRGQCAIRCWSELIQACSYTRCTTHIFGEQVRYDYLILNECLHVQSCHNYVKLDSDHFTLN